jgi:hypothetical protein
MKNLVPDDVISSCQVNKEWASYCKMPSFWSELIYLNLGINRPNATAKDYKFLYNIALIVPKKPSTSTRKVKQETEEQFIKRKRDLIMNVNTILYPKILRFADYLRGKEIEGYDEGLPLSYFEVSPTFINNETRYKNHPISGLKNVFFKAYTMEGAILKLDKYYTKLFADNSNYNFLAQEFEYQDDVDREEYDDDEGGRTELEVFEAIVTKLSTIDDSLHLIKSRFIIVE